MQALIDFEGWRKWRGFNDNPLPTPLADGHTSPMHTGSHGHGYGHSHEPVTKPPSPVSPSLSTRSPAANKDLLVDGLAAREESDDSPRLPDVGLGRDDSIEERDFGPVDESQRQ